MSYIGRSSKLVRKAQDKVSFLATAGQTVKTGLSYTPTSVEVYVNGILLTDVTDYTASNGNSVTFLVALSLNDEVTLLSHKTFSVADHYTKTEDDALLAAKATIANFTSTGIDDNATSTAITIDASENVGIGETSPARFLHVKDPTGGNIVAFFESTDANGSLSIGDNSGSVNVESVAGAMVLNVNGNTTNGGGLTSAMTINNAGIVTKPLQPAFSVSKSAAQVNIAAGDVKIEFDTERFDNNADFNTTTNTFTAPVTGKYQLGAIFRIDTIDTAASYYRLRINTSNVRYEMNILAPNFTSDPTYFSMATTLLADMDVGDTAYISLNSSGGAAQATIHASPGNGIFSGYLVA